MIAWEKIDNKTFENLAFDYMSSNYPDIRWEKTKLTNDGNKDGESIISALPFNISSFNLFYPRVVSIKPIQKYYIKLLAYLQ